MLYFVAIVFPPLAVLLCGKPIQAILNFLLWLCFIIPGIVHAFMVINSRNADKRTKKQTGLTVKAMEQQTARIVDALQERETNALIVDAIKDREDKETNARVVGALKEREESEESQKTIGE